MKVTTANRSVTVSGVEGRNIEVLDITGRSLYNGTGDFTFRLPAAGVYIVSIEGLPAKKIVIK